MIKLSILITNLTLLLVACQSAPVRGLASETTVSEEEVERDNYNRRLDLSSNRQKFKGELTTFEGNTVSSISAKDIQQEVSCLANINNNPDTGHPHIFVGIDPNNPETKKLPSILQRTRESTSMLTRPLKDFDRKPFSMVATDDGKAWGEKNSYIKYNEAQQKLEMFSEISGGYHSPGQVYAKKVTIFIDPNMQSISSLMVEIYSGSRQQYESDLALQARLICTPPLLGSLSF